MSDPQVIQGVSSVAAWRDSLAHGVEVGLVPTMGALHEGHLSLVEAARGENDVVVVSVYVNPTQFGPGEDFEAYPRSLERDSLLAFDAGADVVVSFGDTEMYPEGFSTYVDVAGGLTDRLCGKARPGHFRGVTTIVSKLFHIVRPRNAYFGQKDAQQAAVIRRMTDDLNFGVVVRVMPTVREADGLAMSSRNAYLKGDDRARALCLHAALRRAADLVGSGETDADEVRWAMGEAVAEVGEGRAELEYADLVDPESFSPIDRIAGKALALVAAKVGPARLIDNMLLDPGNAQSGEILDRGGDA